MVYRSYFYDYMSTRQDIFIEILTADGVCPKVELVNRQTVIGRHSSCTLQLGGNDPRVSNRHAVIRIDNNKITIEDLGSTNGLFVNGERMQKGFLKHHDLIRFGTQGPQLRLIVESGETAEAQAPATPDRQNSDIPHVNDVAPAALVIGSGVPDGDRFFDISPDADSGWTPDNQIQILRGNSSHGSVLSSVRMPDPPANNHLFDVSPDADSILNSNTHVPEVRIAYSCDSAPSPLSYDDRLFDVSPVVEQGNLSVSTTDSHIPKVRDSEFHGCEPANGRQPGMPSERNLFDVSPGIESVELNSKLGTTMELSKRLQNQMMNTQDIGLLVKNQKMREKILNDKNIGEQQKHFITTFTKSYGSMKRTHFFVFGLIIVVLCAGVFWFAVGYFNYKSRFSKARSLKNQIESVDDLLEKARGRNGTENSEVMRLYNQLQTVQSQFDSVKAKLEVKDRHKIYSDTIEVFLDEIMNEFNEKNYCIPPHMLERVTYYITLFTRDQHKGTQLLLQRRNVFFTEIERVFSQKNIPKILGYVAMQESLLDSNARSESGAVGMWQFMESTGLRFKLVINDSMDERLDWRKSTIAAAGYFRSLISLFGDGQGVLLAIAAYNAGEEKIRKALENVDNPIRDRDFWYLYRTSTILTIETREYVPQILARIIIDRHPDLYGFGRTLTNNTLR